VTLTEANAPLYQLEADTTMPELDYERQLAAFRALPERMLRRVDPPLVEPWELELIDERSALEAEVTSWTSAVSGWRQLLADSDSQFSGTPRAGVDPLTLLAAAKDHHERGQALVELVKKMTHRIQIANVRRSGMGNTWRPPASDVQTQAQLLGATGPTGP
jgi:hypothetical protein